jgi:HAMP domain-containing protein
MARATALSTFTSVLCCSAGVAAAGVASAFSSRDEIGTLAESFARMRKSLVQAMKMLDS